MTLAASSLFILADPTDELSLSLGYPNDSKFHLISNRRVREVLADRLDQFPRDHVCRLAQHITTLSKFYRFDPTYILSLIDVESGYRTKIVSYAGAVGLMQLMVPTANYVKQDLGIQFSGYEPFRGDSLHKKEVTAEMLKDPFLNTAIGIAYLAFLRDYYQGFSPYFVFAAYNMGPARLDELRVRKTFSPSDTKKYYQAIVRGVPSFRFYERAPKKRLRRSMHAQVKGQQVTAAQPSS